MQPAGKTALLTGAARGNGRAFAVGTLREGARVVTADAVRRRASKTVTKAHRENAGFDEIDTWTQYGINGKAIFPEVANGEPWDDVNAFVSKYENKTLRQKTRDVGIVVLVGGLGTPTNHVNKVVFLTNGAASYIAAQTYNLDGGQWMS